MRGLAVLDGWLLDQVPAAVAIKPIAEATAFRAVAYQPPLYAWLEAIAFQLSTDCNPLLAALPSYLAGALMVVLVYLHGCLWRGPGLGLTAALLVAFNQNVLLRMQEATPTTLVVCGILTALLSYGWHSRLTAECSRSRLWFSSTTSALVGGIALGLALLTLGGFAGIVIPIVLVHQSYLRTTLISSSQQSYVPLGRRGGQGSRGLIDGSVAVGLALIVCLPWFIFMVRAHGWVAATALGSAPDGLLADHQLSLLPRLIVLAPASLPLGLFGAIQAIRSGLLDEANTGEATSGSFWVIWFAIAALLPIAWPSGPQSAFDLVILVPLSLLAGQTIGDLINRRVSVRALVVLAPATALSIAWWTSADLSEAIGDLTDGRADAATALGLHLALDLVIASVWISRWLNRWAYHRDDRQRWILGLFLVGVLTIVVIGGLREVAFRHSETRDLLALRTMILRRNRDIPFRTVAVISPPQLAVAGNRRDPETDQPLPGGRLRFILKSALPRLPQCDLHSIDELFSLPGEQRLIVLAGTEQSLSSADQLKLGVEAIHPGRSGMLGAYATTRITQRSR
jgi:hypothetical protein